MNIKELTGEQRRQLIDTQQVFTSWREADLMRRRRFTGSMRWGTRNGAEYLLRKVGSAEQSLGVRSASTEEAHAAFMRGSAETRARVESLAARLNDLARVNVAMGLGRVPLLAARILRRCDERGVLGEQLFVVGTNALFAYEMLAGVHVVSELLATGDMDLLLDTREGLSLVAPGMRAEGLVGLLRRVDQSFLPVSPKGFRAANKEGYLVDLIAPATRKILVKAKTAALSDLPDDLVGAEIFGLEWLLSAPKVEAVAIDERGYPLRLVAVDPRVFALHKAWISGNADRDPVKRPRDIEQAKTAAEIAVRYLRLSFDSNELSALPLELRHKAVTLVAPDEAPRDTPDWR